MTKLLIDEAVVRQALDALEFIGDAAGKSAITALRAALEQPQQEEVVSHETTTSPVVSQKPEEVRDKQPAQQEPMAWFKHGPYEHGEPLAVVFEDPEDNVCYSPLGFIDPRPPHSSCNEREWQGLTEEEIRTIWSACVGDYGHVAGLYKEKIGHALEAKLKEKNTW